MPYDFAVALRNSIPAQIAREREDARWAAACVTWFLRVAADHETARVQATGWAAACFEEDRDTALANAIGWASR